MCKILSMGFTKEITEIKWNHFTTIQDFIVSNIEDKFYTFIELNSGAGKINNQEGSSLRLLRICKKYENIKFNLEFCEIDRISRILLTENITNIHKQINLHNVGINIWQNNKDLEYIIRYIQPENRGMVISDENGNMPPFERLSKIGNNENYYNLDFLLYIKSKTIKRVFSKYINGSTQKEILRLSQYLEKLNRKYWFIRDSILGDQHGFILIFGSNTIYPNIRILEDKIGLYNIKSEIGNRILVENSYLIEKELNMTKYERKQHKMEI